jgi:hypothetical protein
VNEVHIDSFWIPLKPNDLQPFPHLITLHPIILHPVILHPMILHLMILHPVILHPIILHPIILHPMMPNPLSLSANYASQDHQPQLATTTTTQATV